MRLAQRVKSHNRITTESPVTFPLTRNRQGEICTVGYPPLGPGDMYLSWRQAAVEKQPRQDLVHVLKDTIWLDLASTNNKLLPRVYTTALPTPKAIIYIYLRYYTVVSYLESQKSVFVTLRICTTLV